MEIILSIIVPTYNVEKFIGRCASSILSQISEGVEVIFINDCSSDTSESIIYETIKKYPSLTQQIRVVRTQKNSGIAAVRNLGIELAKGDYIYQVDGDDYLEPLVISKYLDIIKKSDLDILVFDYFIDYGRGEKEEVIYSVEEKDLFLRHILSGRVPPSIWNKIIKKDIILQKDIKFIEGVNFGEDYYWVSRILLESKSILFSDVKGYNYVRYNINSYTSNIKNNYIEGLILILNKLSCEFPNFGSEIQFAKKEKIIKNIKFISDIETLKRIKIFLNKTDFGDLSFIDSVFYYFLRKYGVFTTMILCKIFIFSYKIFRRIKSYIQ